MGWLSKLLKFSASSSSKASRTACRSNSDSSDHVSNELRHEYQSGSSRNSERDSALVATSKSLNYDDEDDDDDDEKDELGGADSTISEFHWWEDEQQLALALAIGQSRRFEPNTHYANVFQPYQDPFFPFANYSDIGHGPPHLEFPIDVLWQPQSTNKEFALLSENNWPHQGVSYNKNHPLCDVCMQPIPVDSKGRLKIKEDLIWQQKYCTSHLRDGTPMCYTCRRLEPIGSTKFSSLRDNRKICGDCQASQIVNIHECQPLIQEIYKFYEGLDMKIYQKEIPVVMADKNEMMDRGCSRAIGLTTYFESAVINTIIQTPIIGPGDTIIGTNEEPFKLVSYREVKDILIVPGHPRLYTGMVVAHEMMHAWLVLEGFQQIGKARGFVGEIPEKMMVEGFCQVMAYMWLDSEIQAISSGEYGSSRQGDFQKKLAQHLQRIDIEKHNDKIYGDGFWLVYGAVSKYGLRGTLDYIRMTGRFPK